MLRVRVIPTLLLSNAGLVKGVKFKNHKYVGDPINAVKIFNEKEVDELVFLDISATAGQEGPNFELIKDIAGEAFIPFGYGGGISNMSQIDQLFRLGVEKVVINSAFHSTPELITEAANAYGSQSIVVSLDVRKTLFGGYDCYSQCGNTKVKTPVLELAQKAQALGAGEIILCNIDKEGAGSGYDLKLIKQVTEVIDIPLVASGGAGTLDDFYQAIEAGSSAVAAGDMFTFHGKHKAVLITYPKYKDLEALFNNTRI